MIGIDTNVLLRYLVQDDPVQSQKATDFVSRLSEEEPGYISVVALVEAAWVLQTVYDLTNLQLALVIERILRASSFVVEYEKETYAAMIAVRDGHGSFSDVLIGALGEKAGCFTTVTFDRKASALSYFTKLQ